MIEILYDGTLIIGVVQRIAGPIFEPGTKLSYMQHTISYTTRFKTPPPCTAEQSLCRALSLSCISSLVPVGHQSWNF
jgi:hypothetical protein